MSNPSKLHGGQPLTVAVSGASGMVGTALSQSLKQQGHQVRRLVREKPNAGSADIYWNPAANEIDQTALNGVDAVVHLAGENISTGRWTAAKKERIRNSRVQGTQLLSTALAAMSSPPSTLIAASAIGYYGDRDEQTLDETSAPGRGFLAEVCRDWEAATEPAREAGLRVVNARIGVILSDQGGALTKMLTPFKLGLGGVIGDGRQYMSWITLDDVVGAIEHALTTEELRGPVNLVAPQSVTNHQFTKTLGKVLHRPTLFPMPAFAVRLAFGEMGDELLLSSTRVEPSQLLKTDYEFRHPELESALRALV